MVMVVSESQAARHARFVSADLVRARIGHLRSQACETCGRTAPHPASATPRERAPRRERMTTPIAQLRIKVKNKVGTYSPLRHGWVCPSHLRPCTDAAP